MFRSISVILALTLPAVAAADYNEYEIRERLLPWETSETNRLLSVGNYIQHQRNDLLYDRERRLRNEAYDAWIERQRAADKANWAAHEQRMDRLRNDRRPILQLRDR